MVLKSDSPDTESGQGDVLTLPYFHAPAAIPVHRSADAQRATPGAQTNVIRNSLILETFAGEKPSRIRMAWRLLQLLFFFVRWVLANAIDRMFTKRSRDERRMRAAERLRKYIEEAGGTIVKLGQQAALRSDLLPEEYCDQLTRLFDNASAFPVSEAYRVIEEHTGKSWQASFAVIEPEPIGRASIACVFRGFLHNGEEVAIKVRRPGIQKQFATDLAVLDMIAQFLEFIMFVDPDLLESFVSETKNMLNEELNFYGEVRYQELFRRYLRRRKKLNVTAPKIYYELSGRDVIVSEFVRGVWITEMMAKVNAKDENYIAWLRSRGIEPRQIAKRLIRSQYYQFHECPFFHGDPHPGNIVVQEGGRIVMVDFGACGVFSERDRNLMLQMHYYYSRGDVGGMVRSVVGLMEPIPRIDVDKFKKHLEDEWWKGYYGIKSKHAHWWERTSIRLWVALLKAYREFSVPMPLRMLRMVRATLLYDTVAAHLHAKINVFTEFEKYYHRVARKARVEVQEAVVRQMLLGPDDSVYLKVQRISHVANSLLFLAEKFFADPGVDFEATIRKVFQFIQSVVQALWTAFVMLLWAVFIGAILVACRHVLGKLCGIPEWNFAGFLDTLRAILPWSEKPQDRTLQVVTACLILFMLVTFVSHGHRILFHFRRMDDVPNQRRI